MFQESDAETLPSLWPRKPGDIGNIGLLDPSDFSLKELPRDWSILRLWEWSSISRIAEPLTAVIVNHPDPAGREVEERLEVLAQRAFLWDTQVLLLGPPHRPGFVGLPYVRLLPQDCRPLAGKIHEQINRSLLVWLKGDLALRFGDTPKVNQFLRHTLLQDVPALVDAVESDTGSGTKYLRRVKDIAEVLNWSRSYLCQRVPFRASAALRVFTFIHGLLLYSPETTTWSSVATRLGFSDAANWNHFCNRVVGVSPSDLCERTRGEWIRQAIDLSFGPLQEDAEFRTPGENPPAGGDGRKGPVGRVSSAVSHTTRHRFPGSGGRSSRSHGSR